MVLDHHGHRVDRPRAHAHALRVGSHHFTTTRRTMSVSDTMPASARPARTQSAPRRQACSRASGTLPRSIRRSRRVVSACWASAACSQGEHRTSSPFSTAGAATAATAFLEGTTRFFLLLLLVLPIECLARGVRLVVRADVYRGRKDRAPALASPSAAQDQGPSRRPCRRRTRSSPHTRGETRHLCGRASSLQGLPCSLMQHLRRLTLQKIRLKDAVRRRVRESLQEKQGTATTWERSELTNTRKSNNS